MIFAPDKRVRSQRGKHLISPSVIELSYSPGMKTIMHLLRRCGTTHFHKQETARAITLKWSKV